MVEGLKFDAGKPRMDLIDPYAIERLAEVLDFGARKYAAHNWRKGITMSRLLGAGLRHIYARLRGEVYDLESGLPHLSHAMCCLMFAVWMDKHRPDMVDLWQPDAQKPSSTVLVDTIEDEIKGE